MVNHSHWSHRVINMWPRYCLHTAYTRVPMPYPTFWVLRYLLKLSAIPFSTLLKLLHWDTNSFVCEVYSTVFSSCLLLSIGSAHSLPLLWTRPDALKLSGVKFGLCVWWPLTRTNRPSMVVWTLQRQPLESLSRHAQFSLSRYWLLTQNLLFRNIRTIFPALDGKKKASVNVNTVLTLWSDWSLNFSVLKPCQISYIPRETTQEERLIKPIKKDLKNNFYFLLNKNMQLLYGINTYYKIKKLKRTSMF